MPQRRAGLSPEGTLAHHRRFDMTGPITRIACLAALALSDAALGEQPAPSANGAAATATPAKPRPDVRAGSACALQNATRGQTPSGACATCHPSGLGGEPGKFTMPGGGTSHAVDVEYERVRVLRPDDFRRAAELPPSITLVGGKITCTTCHDGASHHESQTALHGTELCRACHVF
jgi:hypothetical protein